MIAEEVKNIDLTKVVKVAREVANNEIQILGKFPGLGYTTTTD